jgi:hypothetical protein
MVPAFVWRGGVVRRGVTVGVGAGLFFGVLAWLDSGMLIAGAIVLLILGVGYGIWMARRMTRYWPRAAELNGAQRVAVVAATRRGERIGDDSLAPAVVDYGRALRAAAENGRPWRWVIVFVLVVAVASALWDAVNGSLGNVIVSVVYLVLACLEMFWWPKRCDELLANADRAAAMAN